MDRAGPVKIRAIGRVPGIHRFFNLEVDSEHCYFAGNQEVLSHNVNPCRAGKATQLEFGIVDDIPRLKTVLGSGQDVAPHLGKPGYNLLQMDRSWPLPIRKEFNRLWLDDAIDRGDEIILKTDPIKWDRFMRDIGRESFYNEVELPRLLQRGAIDNAIRDY